VPINRLPVSQATAGMVWDISDKDEGTSGNLGYFKRFRILRAPRCPISTDNNIESAEMSQPEKDQESKREDLDHKPENAGKVGEQNKQLNEKGEQPRPGTPPDPKQA